MPVFSTFTYFLILCFVVVTHGALLTYSDSARSVRVPSGIWRQMYKSHRNNVLRKCDRVICLVCAYIHCIIYTNIPLDLANSEVLDRPEFTTYKFMQLGRVEVT